jgi:hypothetical protein
MLNAALGSDQVELNLTFGGPAQGDETVALDGLRSDDCGHDSDADAFCRHDFSKGGWADAAEPGLNHAQQVDSLILILEVVRKRAIA